MRLVGSFFCLVFLSVFFLQAVEYIYPVASLDDGKTVLLMDQESPLERTLIFWDVETKQASQALWSLFNPSQVQLLFDKSGFSFLDNGRLRIKKFQKRSPKAIDFDKPLYNMGIINWIDECFCYCSAQSGNHFSLFQLCTDGTLCCIASDPSKDYLYPQKINSTLFYIERLPGNMNSHDAYYAIMQTQYPIIDHEYGDEAEYIQINCATEAKLIIDFDDMPLVFLNMLSETEGYVLSHEKRMIDKNNMLFYYHYLSKKNNEWHVQELFSFKIPISLLTSHDENHLYESLLPLLPRMVDSIIYFVDCSHNKHMYLEPYSYIFSTGDLKKIDIQLEHHSFVPVKCGSRFFIGGKNDKKKGSIIDIAHF